MQTCWAIKQGRKGQYRVKIQVRIPFQVMAALRKKAKEKGISISDTVRLFIEKGLAEEN